MQQRVIKERLKAKKKPKYEDIGLKMAIIAALAAEEKKGENITLLDVSRLTIISDYFLLISGHSPAQLEAITRYIESELTKVNFHLQSKEGTNESGWIILDLGNLIVHVMHEKAREYYKLERFWSNARTIDKKVWRKAS